MVTKSSVKHLTGARSPAERGNRTYTRIFGEPHGAVSCAFRELCAFSAVSAFLVVRGPAPLARNGGRRHVDRAAAAFQAFSDEAVVVVEN